MRKSYQSPGQDEKLILLYCPGRGLNSRPPAHRSFKHGQGVPRPLNQSATDIEEVAAPAKCLSPMIYITLKVVCENILIILLCGLAAAVIS